MKEKIKARLKAKFSGVNLSQTRMNAIADKLSKRLTEESEESEIDEALDDLNEIYSFSDIAKSDDRARTEEAKKKANPSEPKKEDPKTEENEDVPAWAKTLIDQNKAQAKRLEALESGKTLDSRKSKLEEKLKDAPEKLKESYLKKFQRMNFKDDEDFDGYLSEVEEEVKEFEQEDSNSGLRGFGPSKSGTGKGNKAASEEEVKSVVDEIMPK